MFAKSRSIVQKNEKEKKKKLEAFSSLFLVSEMVLMTEIFAAKEDKVEEGEWEKER